MTGRELDGTEITGRASLAGDPPPGAKAAAYVPPGGERCRATSRTGLGYTCNAAEGHDGDHAAYGGPGNLCHTWPQDVEHKAAATLAATGLARPHTADVAEFGRANLAGIPVVRTYTCEACGASGTEPTHAPYCDKIHAARLWASVAAAGARDVIAAYPARLKAAIEAGDHDSEPFVLLGELAWSLRSLLAEIDKAAGA